MPEITTSCSRCVLDANYPVISFDAQGVCNYCRRWEKKWPAIDYQKQGVVLEGLLRKFRGRTRPYDCVIGLSGGKDSCYAAYVLKQKGMSPLAVTFENTFMTSLAHANIQSAIKNLHLGHVLVRHDPVLMKDLYRNVFLRTGEFCSVCNVGIRSSIYRVAKAYGIHLIVTGQSNRTEASSPREFFSCENGYFSNVAREFLPRDTTKGYMYFSQLRRIVWHLTNRPYFLQLPSYVPWNEKEFIEVIKREIGWRGSFGEQHTDCVMSHAKEFINLHKYDITELAAKASSLVRDGQLDREAGRELVARQRAMLREKAGHIREEMERELGVSDQELGKTLGISHLKYLDWSDVLLSRLKNAYERIFFRK